MNLRISFFLEEGEMKVVFTSILSQIFVMFVCMAFGYVGYRANKISDTAVKEISGISMNYFLPISLALSFSEHFSKDRAGDWASVLGISGTVLALVMLITSFVFPESMKDYEQKRLCSVIPNNAIFGYAIAEALYGSEGTFLISAQILFTSVLLWEYGFILTSEKPKIKEILLNPAIIGIAMGVVMSYLPFSLPNSLMLALKKLASLQSPLGLIIAGCYVARADLKECFRDLSLYKVSFIKLILAPMLVIPFFFTNVNRTIAMISLVGVCSPTGNGSASFMELIGKDNRYSTNSAALGEVLCVFTIPISFYIAMSIIG